MRLTRPSLRQIIIEEISSILKESVSKSFFYEQKKVLQDQLRMLQSKLANITS